MWLIWEKSIDECPPTALTQTNDKRDLRSNSDNVIAATNQPIRVRREKMQNTDDERKIDTGL